MDQAAQRVTLVFQCRSLGASGEWCSFWIFRLTQRYCYAAGTLLRRRHSGSTWTVRQLLHCFCAPMTLHVLVRSLQVWQACWWEVYDVMLTILGYACAASLLTWHSRHVHPETPFFVLVAFDGWSLTWPCLTHCRSHWAAPRSGEWRDDKWPPASSFFAIADVSGYLPLHWTRAPEQVLVRGLWEAGLGDSV